MTAIAYSKHKIAGLCQVIKGVPSLNVPALDFNDDQLVVNRVTDALTAALSVHVGLNADWCCRAWRLSDCAHGEVNDGDLFLFDSEKDGCTFEVVYMDDETCVDLWAGHLRDLPAFLRTLA